MLSLVFRRQAASTDDLSGQPGEEISADFCPFGFLRSAVADSDFPDAEWSVSDEIGEYIPALAQRFKNRLRE
jgi:hypothetical protein